MSTIESSALTHVLQPRSLPAGEFLYLAATVATTRWGRLPCEQDSPTLTVDPGTTVVIDTVSHEGILEDQGRDPVAYFVDHGVAAEAVLTDAIAIAANGAHEPTDGPHVVTGPIAVNGARPGDLVAVHIRDLAPRVPYGVISSRHGRGLLAQRFPAAGTSPVSIFCAVENLEKGLRAARATIPLRKDTSDRLVRFPLAPFLGLIGVSTPGATRLHSTPPGLHGGNIDIALLQTGTTLYLPVQIPGAGIYFGDPHFAQGNGEIALTALEASLRATVTLDLIPRTHAIERFGRAQGPFAETPQFLVPTGLDEDLDEAVAKCAHNALELLTNRFGMDPEYAYAYMSAATDFDISQVVDIVKGVHARIRISDFGDREANESRTNSTEMR